jgi:hypothetical protein
MEGIKTFEEKREAYESRFDALTKEYTEVCKEEVRKRINEYQGGELDLSQIGCYQYQNIALDLEIVFCDKSLREKLSQITSINLSVNNLKYLPEMTNLPNLINLNLSKNYFTDIPVFEGCEKIKSLDLSENDDIKKVSESILEYKVLQRLNLTGCDKIGEINYLPTTIKVLNLTDSGFPSKNLIQDPNIRLDELIAQYPNDQYYKTVNSEKPFKFLSTGIFQDLKRINIAFTSLSNIDHDIEKLTLLEELDICGICTDEVLTIHPNIFNLPNLKKIIINHEDCKRLDKRSRDILGTLAESGVSIVDEDGNSIKFKYKLNQPNSQEEESSFEYYSDGEEGEYEQEEYEEELKELPEAEELKNGYEIDKNGNAIRIEKNLNVSKNNSAQQQNDNNQKQDGEKDEESLLGKRLRNNNEALTNPLQPNQNPLQPNQNPPIRRSQRIQNKIEQKKHKKQNSL